MTDLHDFPTQSILHCVIYSSMLYQKHLFELFIKRIELANYNKLTQIDMKIKHIVY